MKLEQIEGYSILTLILEWQVLQIKLFYETAIKNLCFLKAVAGLLADSRQIVETARTEASNYRAEYGGNIPVKVYFSNG